MNNRKPKYLIFYISSAGSGILLFSLVTAYGSANLKAPVNIEGHYKIDDRAWPGCLNGNSLWLNIQQSGIYLNGLLANNSNIKETKSSSQARLPLTGEWEDRKFSLAGPVAITACPPNTKVEIGGSVNNLVLSG